MCNLDSMTRSVDAMRKLFAKFDAPETNLPPLPDDSSRSWRGVRSTTPS
jgi:hypothetical protein